MSEIVNRLEDSWDAWLQAGEKEAAAHQAAGHPSGGLDAGHDDWSAAQPDEHHEEDLFSSHQEHGSVDEARAVDNMGYTTTENMILDNETAEGLPYI
jgi:hypothetical protein